LGGDVSNAGEAVINLDIPYIARVRVQGSTPIMWHRWQTDAVEAKAGAAKGSRAKKTDDVESYVWRDENNQLCLPGEYLRQTLINTQNGAAKYLQDPRSPRKSALDLFKAGVQSLTELAPITNSLGDPAKDWDYIDRRRVTVQRAGITRSRPVCNAGWTAELDLMVSIPQYISPQLLLDTLINAGRLVGLADMRPTFGRFVVTRFDATQAI